MKKSNKIIIIIFVTIILIGSCIYFTIQEKEKKECIEGCVYKELLGDKKNYWYFSNNYRKFETQDQCVNYCRSLNSRTRKCIKACVVEVTSEEEFALLRGEYYWHFDGSSKRFENRDQCINYCEKSKY